MIFGGHNPICSVQNATCQDLDQCPLISLNLSLSKINFFFQSFLPLPAKWWTSPWPPELFFTLSPQRLQILPIASRNSASQNGGPNFPHAFTSQFFQRIDASFSRFPLDDIPAEEGIGGFGPMSSPSRTTCRSKLRNRWSSRARLINRCSTTKKKSSAMNFHGGNSSPNDGLSSPCVSLLSFSAIWTEWVSYGFLQFFNGVKWTLLIIFLIC